MKNQNTSLNSAPNTISTKALGIQTSQSSKNKERRANISRTPAALIPALDNQSHTDQISAADRAQINRVKAEVKALKSKQTKSASPATSPAQIHTPNRPDYAISRNRNKSVQTALAGGCAPPPSQLPNRASLAANTARSVQNPSPAARPSNLPPIASQTPKLVRTAPPAPGTTPQNYVIPRRAPNGRHAHSQTAQLADREIVYADPLPRYTIETPDRRPVLETSVTPSNTQPTPGYSKV